MELYFLRHAIAAEPFAAKATEDSKRPLTEEGIETMRLAAEGMKRLGLEFDRVLSSPYQRAKHTAEITVQGIGFSGEIELSEQLQPNASFEDFLDLAVSFQGDERLLLVGHQPSIGEFVSRLISDDPEVLIDFKKGSLCRVDVGEKPGPGSGILKWFLSSRLLRGKA